MLLAQPKFLIELRKYMNNLKLVSGEGIPTIALEEWCSGIFYRRIGMKDDKSIIHLVSTLTSEKLTLPSDTYACISGGKKF